MAELTMVALCGSLRRASWNRALMHEAGRVWAGPWAEADIRFPLYDGDLEEAEGLPPAVQAAVAAVRAADAVVLVTPEYNQSFSGVLKNALDWLSRAEGGSPLKGKPLVILSAAAGRAGGARAQYALRLAVTSVRPRLLAGPEVMVAAPEKEFDPGGRLTAPRTAKALEDLMAALRAEAALLRRAG